MSIKRRLSNGDEVFLAPGIELACAPEDLDAKQEEVTTRVNAWVENLLVAYPDPAEGADDSTDEDDEEEADEEEADEEEEGLTEEDIDGMDKKAILALLKEQEVEIDGAAKMAVKALREAAKEALFGEEDEAEEDEEEEEAEEEEEEDGEEDEGDEAGYTDEELKAMKLEELQEICKEWGIGSPKMAKGADLKAKKAAHIKHIKAAQDAEE